MKGTEMSDVEKLWYALASKFNNPRQWSELTAQEQNIFIDGINRLIFVLNDQGQ